MIFFFYGENSYAISQQIISIKKRYEQKTGTSFSLETFDMTARSLSDLLNAVAVQPLFASTRLIIIKELASNKVAKDNIEQIISSIPETTVAIIWQRDIDRRSSFYTVLSKHKNAQEFKSLESGKLTTWVKRKTAEFGGEIDSSAISMLIGVIGNDQWQLEQELMKLVAYDPIVSSGTISELVTGSTQQTIFKLIDAISEADLSSAITVYRNLILSGGSDQQILTMLNWQYRNLVLVKESAGDYDKIIKNFALSPYVVKRAAQTARSFDLSKLKIAYSAIVAADYAIKSGVKTSRMALEQLIYELVAENK